MTFPPGTRVRLVSMADDPFPIAPGTIGVVTSSSEVDLGDGPFTQVAVRWDGGRSLMVVCPPDVLEVM